MLLGTLVALAPCSAPAAGHQSPIGAARSSAAAEANGASPFARISLPASPEDRVSSSARPDFRLPAGWIGARSRRARLAVWSRPGIKVARQLLDTTNPLGQRTVLLVRGRPRTITGRVWLPVLLPQRPPGSSGWIRLADVHLLRLHQRIVVSLAAHRLTWYRRGSIAARFGVAVGRPAFPTPRGIFYVWARVPEPGPSSPYGVYALGLSAMSPVITDWPGGGRVAIHGTANPADVGRDVSHGCIRVYNPNMTRLEAVPLGTPVIVTD
jgi:lipoprotein-anchoring transpeptidase ErfK/SrfK